MKTNPSAKYFDSQVKLQGLKGLPNQADEYRSDGGGQWVNNLYIIACKKE